MAAACCVPCPAFAPCAMSAGVKSGPRNCYPIHGNQDFSACGGCANSCYAKPPIYPCYKQPRIPDSYAPRRAYMRPAAPVESTTTYSMSYLPSCGCQNLRGIMYKPLPNLVPSCEPMACATTQRMSYQPNPPFVTQPIRPCHHDMWGQGPLQSITTQRHDYVPKPSGIRASCKPPPKFHCLELPFENRTINRMSYINHGKLPMLQSFAPVKCYEKPIAPMSSTTIHKMSYQPVCAPQPQRPPWSCKGQYQIPCQRMEAATTYRMSYQPPGIDCTQCMNPCQYGDCKPNNVLCPSTCFVTSPCVPFSNYPRAGC